MGTQTWDKPLTAEEGEQAALDTTESYLKS